MKTFIYNITFDAKQPRTLARFWSEVTGYPVDVEEDDFVMLRAPDQRGIRRILFYRVEDPTPGKNRVHVDLASTEPEAELTADEGMAETAFGGYRPARGACPIRHRTKAHT